MFDFPSNPSNGQIYGGYLYSNGVWLQSGASLATARGNQNIMVNGGFQVSQYLASAGSSTAGDYVADMWVHGFTAGFGAGSTRGYAGGWARNYMALNNTIAKASLAAGDYYNVQQRIEGWRLAPLHWGSALAAMEIPAVLNFKMSAGVSGTYGVAIQTTDRVIAFDVPYNTAEGLKEVTIPIPVPNGGTWNLNSVNQGANIVFAHTVGTTYRAAASGVWANVGNFLAGPGITNNLATANNTVYFMDVQLLADPFGTGKAPAFIPKSYGEDYAECCRYFFDTHSAVNAVPGYHFLGMGMAYSATLCDINVRFPVAMRISPACSVSGNWNLITTGGGTVAGTPGASQFGNALSTMMRFTSASGLAAGAATYASTGDVNARFFADARL